MSKKRLITTPHLQYTYANLPEAFYEKVCPSKSNNPQLITLNEELFNELGLSTTINEQDIRFIFSGNKLIKNSTPIAMAYAGHQFGHFVPQLGDGRAILIAEATNKQNQLMDIQLKGCGQTKFSRSGDGKAPLSAVIREYILSESMHALGIPTTRALAAIKTSDTVIREDRYPAGIVTRVAKSHIRVGTFEYFTYQQDFDNLKILIDYTISRLFPEISDSPNKPFSLFETVCKHQATLVSNWLRVGFIHGVMNTDNTSIAGETIDFGPCAFLDEYHASKIFSSIDHQGRYAFLNQLNIIVWNMMQLANCLLQINPNKKQIDLFQNQLDIFTDELLSSWDQIRCQKIGFSNVSESNLKIADELFVIMQANLLDYTITFTQLSETLTASDLTILPNCLHEWYNKWLENLKNQHKTLTDPSKLMNQTNPRIIPRNHNVEIAIQAGLKDNFKPMNELLMALKDPYTKNNVYQKYETPPSPQQRVSQTFCGT